MLVGSMVFFNSKIYSTLLQGAFLYFVVKRLYLRSKTFKFITKVKL